MKHVYWFEELNKGNLPIAGGKGANLGEMSNAGFPIPPGFVLSADSYFQFITEHGIDKLIESTLSRLDVEDTNKLNEASKKISEAILSYEMPEEIKSQLVQAYLELKEKTNAKIEYVAVRSSATAEDVPSASFAGQQASFLNVYGEQALLDAVKRCWASLFTPRAIYYRVQQGFEHSKVKIAVVVQHMVQSEKSGVFFTVDPVTQDPNRMVIEAAFGLGETVVSGAVTPDTYVVDKDTLDIVSKHVARQEWMLVRSENANVKVGIKQEYQKVQKLSDDKIVELAKIGREIEKHYRWPQDIEWAIEGNKIFIVQSRPVTTLKKEVKEKFVREMEEKELEQPAVQGSPTMVKEEKVEKMEEKTSGSIILKGLPASPGFATGKVRIILDISELPSMQSGEILVTKMTTPDFVPAMRKASAIITDEGGLTSHAAIVSRELGVPAVIGTEKATSVLKNGTLITVDAIKGLIYEGKVDLTETPKQPATISGEILPVTATKIYVNLAEPEIAEKIAKLQVDGVGLLRAEFMIASIGEHPKKMLREGREKEFVERLAEGIARIAGAFYPRPVVYRATDFKTNEYRNLRGGEEFEPREENPMIGYRGAMRYIREPELFKMELKAIKKVREEFQLKNLWLMIPFVRRTEQVVKIKKMLEEEGLHQSKDFKLWIMVEVPSTVFMIEEMCQTGIDGISIGSNDLTQLILGLDRDNAFIASEFDERSTAVLRAIQHVTKVCRKHNVTVSICGQAPSVYPEIAERLVEFGATSISVNPDAIERTRKIVAAAEQKVLLERTRKIAERMGIEEEEVKHTKS
ncbi:MAG: phosphoenolpyruvate synthase [Candidatus Micrarchaeota archaeon]|nr:phosphoenolpyruvate synthase [Candidatus Micrarchaeota archaeon]